MIIKLSPERQEFLKKNKENIRAVKLIGLDKKERDVLKQDMYDKMDQCKYQYENGDICAASACLSDEERKKIVSCGQNTVIIGTALEKSDLNTSADDRYIMNAFQHAHDEYCKNRTDDKELGEKFMKILNSLVDTGKLPE